MSRRFLQSGAVLAALAVASGAFGAHALRSRLDAESLGTFETAVRYQMYHALALLLIGWRLERGDQPLLRRAGWAFLAGTVLFSGSLYALVLFGMPALGAVTPLGGVAFLAGWGWVWLAISRPSP